MWSEVVDTPKVFYPDKPKSADALRPVNLQPMPLPPEKREALIEALVRGTHRRRPVARHTPVAHSQRIWVGLAAAQILYMVLAAIGKF